MPYVLTPAQAEALSQLLTCNARVYSSPSPSYSLTSVSPSVQYAANTRPCHLQQQHTADKQVFNCADLPKDRSADLITPNISQLPLADTSLASPAMTPSVVRGLQKDTRQDKPFKETDGTEARATIKEQQRCLNLCIALLDQKLHSKITESIVVGFLAVLSINRERTGFDNPVTYNLKLSTLVKIAQLLITQQAITKSKAGHTKFLNKLITKMQDRFIVYSSKSPMNWILNLRAYSAKLQDNTTCSSFVE
jgi:hypothetical protein